MKGSDEFTIDDIKILVDLYCLNLPKILNFATLARELELSATDPKFRYIQKYLLDNEIITIKGIIGSSKILEIDKKKLKEKIPEIPIIRFINDEVMDKVWGKGYWDYS